jgi:hypothetical protein
MKIEKVKNGFIVEVEVEVELPEHATASTIMRFNTEKHIFRDLTDLLNFINSHYGKEGYSVIEIIEEVSTE